MSGTSAKPASGLKVAVVGGSIGGLTAALVLRDIGCDVDVYERSSSALEGYGAGIVAHDEAVRYFRERTEVAVDDVTLKVPWFRYVNHDGETVFEEPNIWRYSSWNTIYRGLLGQFDGARYQRGEALAGIEQVGDRVKARFESGRVVECDLLVCADGNMSTARRLLMPDVEPDYAGYVGWRGMIAESEVAATIQERLADAITYFVPSRSQFLIYPIPSLEGSIARGERLFNFVWYRNTPDETLRELLTDREGVQREFSLPPGALATQHLAEFRRDAEEILPARIAEVVTQIPDPFLQAIVDVSVPHMAVGRVCLVGDAAFVGRPHAAAGTAKAASDAWALAEALVTADGNVEGAISRWEPRQLSVGRNLVERVQYIGDRAFVKDTWVPGDKSLQFGLYGPGD